VTPTFEGEPRVEDLQQKIALLEQGMKQAANVREMWSKAVRELKATKSELKSTVADLTAARDELDRKNASLAQLNLQLQEEMAQRERIEVELRLAQKLESIGQLAAGIAHEINTPIQYIGDNTEYLSEAFDAYLELFTKLRPIIEEGVDLSSPIAEVAEVVERSGLADLADDVPDAIADTLEGVEHVASIVKSMKEFSRKGSQEKVPVDINHALETTVNVARGEWKHVAEIEWQLDEELPKVYAIGAELNQVFLNLLVNAAQAVGEANEKNGGGMGVIRLMTQPNETGVVVTVSDSGTGIPEGVMDQIFDPFFTTKDVGEGSGQGLSIAHSIIVDHHGGKIDVASEPGEGATFTVWLPMGLPG
jgi:signal transduction histidine kinase